MSTLPSVRELFKLQATHLALCVAVFSSPAGARAQSQPSAMSPALSHEQRANEYLREKKPELAIPELRAALADDPTNLNAQANLGVLLFFQRDYAAAVPYLRQAVAQKPDLSKIRALLGLAEQYLGQSSEARADLEAAAPQLTETGIALQAGLALVEIDEAGQDFDKAEAEITRLRQLAPTDPRVLYAAYRVATDAANDAMLALSLAAPDSAQMHQAMGHELERALDSGGAIANLRKAAELDPALPGIHFELAEALRGANDSKLRAEAESQYKHALAQNPRDARSANALGVLAKARGNNPEAVRYFKLAFSLDPKLPDAAIAMASIDEDNSDFGAAAAKLEAVVNDDPTSILAHYRLSAVYRKLGRADDAKRELDAFQHYKQMKAKMAEVYTEMRQHAPGELEPSMPTKK
jgi:tetratricopeptide (TPR) repeat protein